MLDLVCQQFRLFSSTVQADWNCVLYPHGKASKPRDPVQYIQDYKMEEVADLLWIGGIAAKHATEAWQTAWEHLRAACEHYVYGFDSTEDDCRQAHNRLYAYAELCEEAVINGQVRCHTSSGTVRWLSSSHVLKTARCAGSRVTPDPQPPRGCMWTVALGERKRSHGP
jgi:hypothetical protein